MRLAALFSLWLSLLPSLAFAHAGDATGFASIAVRGAEVSLSYTPAAAAKVDAAALPALLREKIDVEADGHRCVPQPGDGLNVDFHCGQAVSHLQLRDRLPEVLGDQHHVIAMLTWDGGSLSHAFSSSAPLLVADLHAHAAAPQDAGSFFLLGVEHIATGYDHLLFVLALVLCGGNLVSLLKIITAFTVAHSLTLGAAALDLLTLPSTLVEAVIALSIAYVAFENLMPKYALSRRWLVSFLFGLVHGFGFSSVLKEIGLPKGSELLALLNFNLGVEAGQIVAVLLVLPVLAWLKTTAWETRAVRAVSFAVLVIGLALFAERAVMGA